MPDSWVLPSEKAIDGGCHEVAAVQQFTGVDANRPGEVLVDQDGRPRFGSWIRPPCVRRPTLALVVHEGEQRGGWRVTCRCGVELTGEVPDVDTHSPPDGSHGELTWETGGGVRPCGEHPDARCHTVRTGWRTIALSLHQPPVIGPMDVTDKLVSGVETRIWGSGRKQPSTLMMARNYLRSG